jgi:hypothetical protein
MKRRPERAVAIMRQREQRIIVETEQRRFERDGEGEIILRHQQEIGKRHQILHRELIHQFHAVSTRHGHAKPLQFADHRRGEGVAASDQDENIAGSHLAALRGKILRADPAFDRGGDTLAESVH